MLRVVILDDEERGSTLLHKKLLFFAGELEVLAVFNDPLQALNGLPGLHFDLLFLDVEMPGLNGFQFLQKLGVFNFEVVFVTAYNAYTLDALRINALDYLLKPVDQDELMAAIERLKKKVTEKQRLVNQPPVPLPKQGRVALPTAEGVYLVKKTDIIRVEAMSNYSVFYLPDNRKIIVSRTLKEYELILTELFFLRINRSVIVNLEYVAKYKKGDGGTLVLNDGAELEVSPAKKDILLSRLFD
jgi:two-component system LytT family response regulator